MTDDIKSFEKEINRDLDDVYLPYAAYALGSKMITVYTNPSYSIDKFDMAHTLSHELVHIFHHQINPFAQLNTPYWFIEGLAESLAYPRENSYIHNDIEKFAPNLDSISKKLKSSDAEEYMTAYDVADLFVEHLIAKYGEEKIISLTNLENSLENDFKKMTGVKVSKVYQKWLRKL